MEQVMSHKPRGNHYMLSETEIQHPNGVVLEKATVATVWPQAGEHRRLLC